MEHTSQFRAYATAFHQVLDAIEVTDADGAPLAADTWLARTHDTLRPIPHGHNKVMFIGNGGSAGIAGHMAIDFAKNGGVRAITFNDASSLTCLGNDLGYDQVFAQQVKMQGLKGDVLIAISSSGKSANILNGVAAAKAMGCTIITLSGFGADNPLRKAGATNFYVPARIYGFVETGHQAILHAILDTAMGWTPARATEQPTNQLT